ncbi:MAG: CoA pyrophosphatase [Deltaproteobacteria bacterium]|nr:MAG: CoA pyrophosphatase [Deltaproteobacteria bacterium]
MPLLGPRRWRPVATRSAVAVILRDGPRGDEVLLTRRAAREGDRWSGHVSFPGGRAHPEDRDAAATARRETLEEIGLELGDPAHRLPSVLTLAHGSRRPMAVDPFVFRIDGDPELRLNHEVAAAFWVPLAALASGELATRRPWRLFGRSLRMPAWQWEEHVIWGLTYEMLRSLLHDPRARSPR